MGIGPLIAWRRTSSARSLKTLRWPIARRARHGRRAARRSAPARRGPGLIAYTFCAFVLATIVRRARARDARRPARSFELVVAQPPPLRRLRRARLDRAARDRHRRLELVRRRRRAQAPAGPVDDGRRQHVHLPRDRARRKSVERERDARACSTSAAARNGTLKTGHQQLLHGDTSREVGIHTNWLRAEDIYVIFDQRERRRRVFFKVLVKPLVNLIWIAGIVFLFGSLVALWPDAREQRRLIVAARTRASMTALVLGAADRGRRGRPRRAAVPARAGRRRRPARRAHRGRGAAAAADRGARPRARRAEGARVRPPHGQDRRRRLPRHGRAAAPRRRRRAARARRDAPRSRRRRSRLAEPVELRRHSRPRDEAAARR